MAELEATVRRRDQVSVVDLAGEIDLAAEAPLQAAWADAADPDHPVVVLNFERVAYIDSSGIALLVELLARAGREGRAVAAYGLIDHYRRIFEITRLSEFMGIYPDEDSAVRGTPVTAAKEEG